MLQKLKLTFNLESINIQGNLANLLQELNLAQAAAAASSAPAADGATAGAAAVDPPQPVVVVASGAATGSCRGDVAQLQALQIAWQRRLAEVVTLMSSVSTLLDDLHALCRSSEQQEGGPDLPATRNPTQAVLDFILSTLITPR